MVYFFIFYIRLKHIKKATVLPSYYSLLQIDISQKVNYINKDILRISVSHFIKHWTRFVCFICLVILHFINFNISTPNNDKDFNLFNSKEILFSMQTLW